MPKFGAAHAPLLWPAVGLMGGIAGEAWLGGQAAWLLALVAALLSALAARRWPLVQSLLVSACFVGLGGWLSANQSRALRADWPAGRTDFEAVVLTTPAEKAKTMAVDLLLTGAAPAESGAALTGRRVKAYLHKDERSRALRVGDGLRVRAQIRRNSEWRRGRFNYRRYLETHGFSGTIYVASADWQPERVSLRGVSRLERTRLFFLQQRERLLQRLALPEGETDPYAVVAAMTLGDKSALTAELKEVYAQTGASHVLALSGLHLSIVYALFSLMAGGRRRQLAQLAVVLGIWAFAFLTGLSVSIVRAATMLSVYALLSLGHREKMSVNVLAFTAIVMLMVTPNALFDVGFQLSFMAVLAILTFMPLFGGLVSQQFLLQHRWLRWCWQMVGVSCAAQLGVAPLIAYYFGRFSTYFLLTNFIVVPAVIVILHLAVAVMVVPSLAGLLLAVAGCLNRALTTLSGLPCASIEGLHPSPAQVALMYVAIGASYMLVRQLYSSGLLKEK